MRYIRLVGSLDAQKVVIMTVGLPQLVAVNCSKHPQCLFWLSRNNPGHPRKAPVGLMPPASRQHGYAHKHRNSNAAQTYTKVMNHS